MDNWDDILNRENKNDIKNILTNYEENIKNINFKKGILYMNWFRKHTC